MGTRHPRPAALQRSAFTGFRFPAEVIVLAVRWYLRFGLSDNEAGLTVGIHHLHGASEFRPPETRRPRPQTPRSTSRRRSPPRTAADARGVPPAVDQVTALEHAAPDQLVDAHWLPSQLLTLEMLRRPVESTLRPGVTVVDQRVGRAALADPEGGGLPDRRLPLSLRAAFRPPPKAFQQRRPRPPGLRRCRDTPVGR
jgi:hypothetical protein